MKRKLEDGEIIGLTNLALKESYGPNYYNSMNTKAVSNSYTDEDTKKDLSPLEAFYKIIDMALEPNGYQNFTNGCDSPYVKIVETALKNYQEGIENSKSYKSRPAKDALFNLECLALKNTDKRYWKMPEQLAEDVRKEIADLKEKYAKMFAERNMFADNLFELRCTYEDQIKALEIIREKRVCVYLLDGCDNVEQYNNSIDLFEIPKKNKDKYHLTQTEYDLLKAVCCYANK